MRTVKDILYINGNLWRCNSLKAHGTVNRRPCAFFAFKRRDLGGSIQTDTAGQPGENLKGYKEKLKRVLDKFERLYGKIKKGIGKCIDRNENI